MAQFGVGVPASAGSSRDSNAKLYDHPFSRWLAGGVCVHSRQDRRMESTPFLQEHPCMDATGQPRVALVHDWLTGMRGGEKCLEVLCRRWPHARLFTLLHRPGAVSPAIEQLAPRTSFLQHLPHVHRYYRYLLPIMPAAAATWRVR